VRAAIKPGGLKQLSLQWLVCRIQQRPLDKHQWKLLHNGVNGFFLHADIGFTADKQQTKQRESFSGKPITALTS
jgi:hypothetical protein